MFLANAGFAAEASCESQSRREKTRRGGTDSFMKKCEKDAKAASAKD